MEDILIKISYIEISSILMKNNIEYVNLLTMLRTSLVYMIYHFIYVLLYFGTLSTAKVIILLSN